MTSNRSRDGVWLLLAGVTVGSLAAWLVLGRDRGNHSKSHALPGISLGATATHGSDTMAAATGPVDDDTEGIFTLDFTTGLLRGAVLGRRNAKFAAYYYRDVRSDLGVDPSKRARYLLVTGQVNLSRGGGLNQPGRSVIYVVDANTGNFAAYGIPSNPTRTAVVQVRTYQLKLLDVGRMPKPSAPR